MCFKNRLTFIFVLLFAFSCSEKIEEKKALGGKKYGGRISYVATEKINSFFPLNSYSLQDQRLLSNLFESLFKLDSKSKKIVPNLARTFSVKNEGKLIELVIRKNIFFHTDNYNHGALKKMTIEDVKFSLEFACSGNKLNQLGHVLTKKIVGAEWYQKHSKNSFPIQGVSGIKIKNDSTILIELTNSYNNFLSLLCHPNMVVFSKDAYLYYGKKSFKHPIGTGPFQLHSESKSNILLSRNRHYWKKDKFGNQLPFLDEIQVILPNSAKNEQLLFSQGQTDVLMHLPVDKLEYAFGTLNEAQKGKNLLHRVLSRRGIKVNYIAFDCTTKPFNDERVRKAFYLAIDKEELWLNVLNGDGNIDSKGFVPRSDFYKDDGVESASYNPTKARQLLAAAGYSKNNSFPVLDFYIPTAKGTLLGVFYQKLVLQIKRNLGIELRIKYTNFDNRNRLVAEGKIKIWKAGWVSDYPDPESYLSVFYSGYKGQNSGLLNLNKYKNAEFDSLFYRSNLTTSSQEKLRLQNKCDQLLVNHAAVVPLYTEDICILVNIRARDLKVSSSGIIDYSEAYIKEVRKK